jgi:hypothetical protein
MKYAILKIHPFLFVEFCKHGADKVTVAENRIPEDAKFVRAFTEDSTGWGVVSLVLESESFEDLKQGDRIPVLPDPIFEKEI